MRNMKREEKRTGVREGEAGRGGNECGREVGGEAVAVETLEGGRRRRGTGQGKRRQSPKLCEGDASEFPESSPPFSGALLGSQGRAGPRKPR